MMHCLLVLPLLLGFPSQGASARIIIEPGNGVTVVSGGYIYVHNGTDEPAFVEG